MSPAIRRTDTISLLGQRLRILLPTQPQAQWGHSFDPRSENIPHAVGQLSPFTTATEPVCLQPGLCNKRSHRHETREEPPHPDQSQHAANQPSKKKKKEKTKRKRFRKDLRELKKKRTRSPVDTVSPSCWEIVHSPHQGHRGGARRALQPVPHSCHLFPHVLACWALMWMGLGGSYVTPIRGPPPWAINTRLCLLCALLLPVHGTQERFPDQAMSGLSAWPVS